MSLAAAMQVAIRAGLEGVHTALPARVESYDPARTRANVKPLGRRRVGDDVVTLPVVPAVPVVFPRAGAASLTFPLAKGDTGLLVFTERSLENFLAHGGDAAPSDPRRFDLTDGVFLPGLYPFNAEQVTEEADALVLKNGAGKLKLRNGTVALGTEVEELLALLSETLQELSTATTATLLGAQPLSAAPAFAALKIRLDSIKGTI